IAAVVVLLAVSVIASWVVLAGTAVIGYSAAAVWAAAGIALNDPPAAVVVAGAIAIVVIIASTTRRLTTAGNPMRAACGCPRPRGGSGEVLPEHMSGVVGHQPALCGEESEACQPAILGHHGDGPVGADGEHHVVGDHERPPRPVEPDGGARQRQRRRRDA